MDESIATERTVAGIMARWKTSGLWHGVVAAVNVVPDLTLAVVFLVTWIAPLALGADSVKRYMLVMLLEFIVIHSAAFMGTAAMATTSRTKKTLSIIGFGLFYSLFAGGFSVGFHTWWPFIAFWVLTLNRLVSYVASGTLSPAEQNATKLSWGVSAMLYLATVFLTTFAPVPRLGIVPEVLRELHLPGSGLWIEQPWHVMAAGFLYFTGQAVFEITVAIRNWRRIAPAAAGMS